MYTFLFIPEHVRQHSRNRTKTSTAARIHPIREATVRSEFISCISQIQIYLSSNRFLSHTVLSINILIYVICLQRHQQISQVNHTISDQPTGCVKIHHFCLLFGLKHNGFCEKERTLRST